MLRWFDTGDEVAIDKNNDFLVVDRLKEISRVLDFRTDPRGA